MWLIERGTEVLKLAPTTSHCPQAQPGRGSNSHSQKCMSTEASLEVRQKLRHVDRPIILPDSQSLFLSDSEFNQQIASLKELKLA